jgi:hypothetical protein
MFPTHQQILAPNVYVRSSTNWTDSGGNYLTYRKDTYNLCDMALKYHWLLVCLQVSDRYRSPDDLHRPLQNGMPLKSGNPEPHSLRASHQTAQWFESNLSNARSLWFKKNLATSALECASITLSSFRIYPKSRIRLPEFSEKRAEMMTKCGH